MALPGVSIFGSDGVGIGVAGAIATIPGTGVQAPQATTNVAVPINASNVTVRTGAGRLFSVTVTTVGTATSMTFTDNGVTIAALTGAQVAALGTYQINVPFTTNLVVVGNALNAALSVAEGF